MHILGHILVGGVGYAITKNPLFLVGSIIPDIVLIPNELTKKKFDKWNVKYKFLYDFTHSLFFPAILLLLSPITALAVLTHILLDIPFHTSAFRWKPFLISRYSESKKALLLSGGADSILSGMTERNYDCFFFDYGQSYLYDEYEHAKNFCHINNFDLIVIKKNWYNDIKDRNILMINELRDRGYMEVIIGTRNILPIFDKYGDSNWLRLKLLQFKLGIYINMPIVGLLKWQIIKKIGSKYTFYSTENI